MGLVRPTPKCSPQALPLYFTDVTPLRKPRTSLETFKKVGIPIIAALLSLAIIVIVAVLSKW